MRLTMRLMFQGPRNGSQGHLRSQTCGYADDVLGAGVLGMTAMLAMRGLGATFAALRHAYLGRSAEKDEHVLRAFFVALVAFGVLTGR